MFVRAFGAAQICAFGIIACGQAAGCDQPVEAASLLPTLDWKPALAVVERARLLTSASRSADGLREGHALYKRAMQIIERDLGKRHEAVASLLIELGDYEQRMEANDAARGRYRNAVAILAAARGDDHLSLAAPLVDLARVNSRSGRHRTAQKALESALQVYDQHPCAVTREVFDALVLLGDSQLRAGARKHAKLTYRQAWQRLEADVAHPGVAAAFFSKPARLQFVAPTLDSDHRWNAEEVSRRFVEVDFTVTPEGRVRDLNQRVDAPIDVTRKCVTAARAAIYRPRLAEGEPVATSGVRIRFTFGPQGVQTSFGAPGVLNVTTVSPGLYIEFDP